MVWALVTGPGSRGPDGRDPDERPEAGYCRFLLLLGDGVGPRPAGNLVFAGNPLPGLSWIRFCSRLRPALD